MSELTRSQAFHYYECCGLSFADIDEKALQYLLCLLDEQIALYRKDIIGDYRNEERPCKWSFVLRQSVRPTYDAEGALNFCKISVKCEDRSVCEAITFLSNSSISFAKESTEEDAQPILEAFIEFCSWLEHRKYDQSIGFTPDEEAEIEEDEDFFLEAA